MKHALARLETDLSPDEFDAILQKIRVTRNPEKYRPYSGRMGLVIDTRNPDRWYHRFAPLTASAGGFSVSRDIQKNHGPLGAMYTTPKEGDSTAFIYLFPTGMNRPDQPTWGSWTGRYALPGSPSDPPKRNKPDPNIFAAYAQDEWEGTRNRDNTLARWAEDMQNDFAARMDWCVAETFEDANHPPHSPLAMWEVVELQAAPGERVTLRASSAGEADGGEAIQWTDPDGDELRYQWILYREPGGFAGELDLEDKDTPLATFTMPDLDEGVALHFILRVTDTGTPPLTRYGRVIVRQAGR